MTDSAKKTSFFWPPKSVRDFGGQKNWLFFFCCLPVGSCHPPGGGSGEILYYYDITELAAVKVGRDGKVSGGWGWGWGWGWGKNVRPMGNNRNERSDSRHAVECDWQREQRGPWHLQEDMITVGHSVAYLATARLYSIVA